MNHLYRDLAPVSASSWELIDDEVREQLTTHVAARRLVDFAGPLGWTTSSLNVGRVSTIAAPNATLSGSLRQVMPLAELRAPFLVSREELRAIDRGATNIDFTDLEHAALLMAEAENAAIVSGWAEAGITGIGESTSSTPIALNADYSQYPKFVASAVERLRALGIGGPYGLALGPASYLGVVESTEHGGLIVFDHLRKILGGPIVRTPGVLGAVVLSLRGGDFNFVSGEDFSVGYESHDEQSVRLFIEESFAFKIETPEAAVLLSD